ncbi:MAG: hypothetical protein JXD22_07405 [Sedimentisphaerales bacterium]|nr:hypothetical protein [Sedimentisphaerales bacterium]
MAKIKLDSSLYDRAKRVAQIGGYSGVDEFVVHVIEKELDQLEAGSDQPDKEVQDRLRGLGYIE